MPDKIFFNGKEYGSVDEMAPEVRAYYEDFRRAFPDLDHDNIPDILEKESSKKLIVTGEPSPLKRLEASARGHETLPAQELPDWAGKPSQAEQSQAPDWLELEQKRHSRPAKRLNNVSQEPVIEPDRPNIDPKKLIFLLLILLLVLFFILMLSQGSDIFLPIMRRW